MLYRFILVSEADLIKIMDFLASEGIPMPYGRVDAIPTVAGCGGVYRASGVATGGDAIHPTGANLLSF